MQAHVLTSTRSHTPYKSIHAHVSVPQNPSTGVRQLDAHVYEALLHDSCKPGTANATEGGAAAADPTGCTGENT
jgi:hypothetical protein